MTALPPPVDDLAAWLGQSITDETRAEAVLSAASAIVSGYAGQDWSTEDAPADVAAVVIQVAARVWRNPAGLQSVTIDDATQRWFESTASGLFLTDEEKSILNRFRTTASGLGVLSTTRNEGIGDTIYVPTGPPPAGYPFPWYAADGY